jgi:hypothetical protein
MVQKSFITEAYTNLCKDKDTYFYNFLQAQTGNTYNPVTVTPQNAGIKTADQCRKECDSRNCAIYTLDHTPFSPAGQQNNNTNSGTCNLYSESNLNTTSKFLVDCGNKSNYKGIPQNVGDLAPGAANAQPNRANLGIKGIGPNKTGVIGTTKGYGYIDPEFFRKNINKFKDTNYVRDKTQLIIDEFKVIKESVKQFADLIGDLKNLETADASFKAQAQAKSAALTAAMGTAGEAAARNDLINYYRNRFAQNNMKYSPLLDFIIEKRLIWGETSDTGSVTFAYTAPVYVSDKLQTIKKYIRELEVYLDIDASKLFSKLIPKSEYKFRIESTGVRTSPNAGGMVTSLGSFRLAEIDPTINDSDFVNPAITTPKPPYTNNYIIIIRFGDGTEDTTSWPLGDDSVEPRTQLFVSKLFSEIYKKEKNLAGEKENVEAKRKKLFQTIFVYGLLFAISIIIFVTFLFKSSIIKPKYLIILFILIIALIIFMNYYVEIKNFLNFKDYLYS